MWDGAGLENNHRSTAAGVDDVGCLQLAEPAQRGSVSGAPIVELKIVCGTWSSAVDSEMVLVNSERERHIASATAWLDEPLAAEV